MSRLPTASFNPLQPKLTAPIALTVAACYWFSFAYANGAAAILLALPCLCLLGQLPSSRRALYGGLLLGMAMYVPHLAFFHSVFGPPGMVLWLVAGLPIGIFLLLLRHAHLRLGPTWACWLTPILWTGIEYFRSECYYLRFAWLLPGQAVAFLPGLRMLRIGVYGLGFIFALAAALLVAPRRSHRIAGIIATISLAIFIYVPKLPPATSEGALHVAGIQLEFPDERTAANALDRLAIAHPEAQLLVLSEYTFPGPVPAEVRAIIQKHHRYLIAGGRQILDAERYYNTAFVIGPDGQDLFHQPKSIPVQFMIDGLPAPDRRVWDSPWGKLGIAVCYDSSYARVMDDFVRQGARGLIIPTMDLTGWGEYERRMLHGRMAPVRSAEYGIPTFSVWSSGVSQLTDRFGRIIETAPYPGQGEMIAGPMDLRDPGRVPPDRLLATAAMVGTGAFILYLLVGPWIERMRGAGFDVVNPT
jgi:apolipoprotein N-acyltransferase